MKNKFNNNIRRRDINFADKISTSIWEEIPSEENPYLITQCRCHGYDLFDLASKRSFVDVFFLLFNGELPTPNQSKLLEKIFIILINLGPRHPANRAAMSAGVSKTRPSHFLPIGLSVLSGDFLGANEVSSSMFFLKSQIDKEPTEIANKLIKKSHNKIPKEGDYHIAPGFGSQFGSIDPFCIKIIDILDNIEIDKSYLQWGINFARALNPYELGWLLTGVAAAVFCDLGFNPKAGAGLYQISAAPGILAHGLEYSSLPLTAMPFLDANHYIIDEHAKTK